MTRTAARLVMRMGVALLLLAALARLAGHTQADHAGDDLAIIASGLLMIVGALVARFGPD
jgi:hypothetical protein